MRKQVLVSVDRGETRVALLEATGQPEPEKVEEHGQQRRTQQTEERKDDLVPIELGH